MSFLLAGSFHSELTYFQWPEFRTAYVEGSFSGWESLKLTEKSAGGYYIAIKLPIGVHLYCFQVDGERRTDPYNKMPLINGFNQIEVLPILPAYIPNSLKGNSLDHLFLSFSSSFVGEVLQFVRNCGLRRILISIIILDPDPYSYPDRVSACALLKQGNDYERTRAQKDINDSSTEKSELRVLRFQKNSVSVNRPESASPYNKKVVITSVLPDYIIDQHVLEHFGYFSSYIERVEKCAFEQNFSLLFHSAHEASEAVSAYNNSIFMGIKIQVILVEVHSVYSEAEQMLKEATSSSFGQQDDNSATNVDPKELIGHTAAKWRRGDKAETREAAELCEAHLESEAATVTPGSEEIKVFIRSNPKFSASVHKEHLMKHFKNFDPVNAYLIRNQKTKKQTGTGVVVLPSRRTAEGAIAKMRNSKILDKYSISLELEHPPLETTKEYSRNKHSSSVSTSKKGTGTELPRLETTSKEKRVRKKCSSTSLQNVPKTSSSVSSEASKSNLSMVEHSSTRLEATRDRNKFFSASPQNEPKPSSLVPLAVSSSKSSKAEHSSTRPATNRPEVHSVKIKVSHLPQGTTVKDLKHYFEKIGPLDGTPELHLKGYPPYSFVKFKMPESAEKAVNIKNPELKDCSIKICIITKEAKAEQDKSAEPKLKDYVTRSMKLESTEWNMLMTRRPKSIKASCSTLLEVIISSYSNNDVTYDTSIEKSSIDIKGKSDFVDLLCEDIITILDKGELSIDRLVLQALMYLKPSLPLEVKECYDVTISGFEENSKQIQFFGSVEGIKRAHETVSRLVARLHKSEKTLQPDCQFPEDQLKYLRDEVTSKCFICLSHSPPFNVLILYTLEDSVIDAEIMAIANSVLVSIKVLDIPPDKVRFLTYFGLPDGRVPARMSINADEIHLSGTFADIEASEKILKDEILLELHCQTFSYFCEGAFESQIEKNVLHLFKEEDSTFIWKCSHKHSEQKLVVIISSKKKGIFCRACKELENLEPKVETFSIGLPPDGLKMELELKHRTVINCVARDSVQIYGLSSSSIDECYKELVDNLELTELKSESISISKYHYQYFINFHSSEIEELNKICKVRLSSTEENGKYCIEISGTVKQVKIVQEKLNSGLLTLNIHGESFDLSCPSSLASMWCALWEKVIKEESKPCFYIEYKKSHCESSIDVFNFDLIGKEISEILKVKDLIYANGSGTDTAEDVIQLSDAGINTLLEARKTGQLQFISDLHICFVDINNESNTTKVCAPKRLEDNLVEGVEKIKGFVLAHTRTSVVIESQDPIVQLVLSSDKKREAYLKNAHIEAEKYNSEVEFVVTSVNDESKGFKISASELSLSSAADAVRNVTINAIQKNIFRKVVEFEPIFRPLLHTPDFDKVAKKLENGSCVICSLSSVKPENDLIYTACFQEIIEQRKMSVKIHIGNGNIALENTDCIINFATENLNFHEVLSQVISEHGGPTIQAECYEYVQDASKQLSIGDVFCLDAGNLTCRFIIHAILPNWNKEDLEEDVLYTVLSNIFELAKDNSLAHLSIPVDCSGSIFAEALYAETLLKVIEDHHKKFSSSSLCDVNVVLENYSSAEVFVHAMTSHHSIAFVEKHSKPTSTKSSSPMYEWCWQDDTRNYSPYSSDQNAELSLAFNNNPKGLCNIGINIASYTVNFESMTQTNDRSQYIRKITKTVVAEKDTKRTVEWKYINDLSMFAPYSKEDSVTIEEMYQAKVPSLSLRIGSAQYTIDIEAMSQFNVLTKFERKIQRCTKYEDDNDDDNDDDNEDDNEDVFDNRSFFAISLRGLQEELPKAEEALLDGLSDYIKSELMDDIPVNIPQELEDEIEKIADSNFVTTELQDSSDETCRSLTLKGVDSMVKKTIIGIQKELIKLKSAVKPNQYVFSAPPEWELQTDEVEVFNVTRGSHEWNTVEQKFSATMSTHTLTKILRIQNKLVWERYSFHKKLMEGKNGGIVNEMYLFHGSRQNKPEDIYEGENGFDMRYSREGMWGHANYFAVNARYSHDYAYTEDSMSRFLLRYGLKQMFLAIVLTGDYYVCAPNSSLRMPPIKVLSSRKQHDSVKGNTNGSDVFMTYDNEKAYPAYLITYQ